MRGKRLGWVIVVSVLVAAPNALWACDLCKVPSCTGIPTCQYAASTYQCVKEKVPYTVTRTVMKKELRPETCTEMVKVPVTTLVDKTCTHPKLVMETKEIPWKHTTCRLVRETKMVEVKRVVCRPVKETTWVDKTTCVCEPVTTSRVVTNHCIRPVKKVVAVPTCQGCSDGCGLGLLCGKHQGLSACGGVAPTGCQYATQICFERVPVTRTVCETTFVKKAQTHKVPVTTCKWVKEVKCELVPVTTCRLVKEEKCDMVKVCCPRIEHVTTTQKVPVTTYKCEAQQRTRMVKVCAPQQVTETCYKTVVRKVPICPPAPCASPCH